MEEYKVIALENGLTAICGIDKATLDLDKTLDCGQCFRWKKQDNLTWRGVVKDKIYSIGRTELNGEDCLLTDATVEDWNNTLYDYFDLGTDYSSLSVPESDKFAQQAQKFGRGIRILKQDNWEALVSFIISQRNNIPKIKGTIERLCFKYGDPIYQYNSKGEPSPHIYYSFPSADTISKLDIEDLDGIGLGYRDEYIIMAAKAVTNKWIDLEELEKETMTGNLAVLKLTGLRGVGPKVANCVALFGLHKLSMFPIDVWIQRIIDIHYNGNIDVEAYGKLAGLMQQYMFYYIKYKDKINV